VQALAYDQSARAFTPLWKGPSDAFGSPIVSGGLVWALQTGGFGGGGVTLYGLDLSTGVPATPRRCPAPSPITSALQRGGRQAVPGTGSTVTAYQIAKLTPAAGATPIAISAPRQPHRACRRCYAAAYAPTARQGANRLRCAAVSGHCKGTITLRAKFVLVRHVGSRRVRRTIFTTLAHARFNHAKGSFTTTVYLGRKARRVLRRHDGRLALQ